MNELERRGRLHVRLIRRSRWRVALLGAVVVAGLLALLSAGAYLLARQALYGELHERLAGAARRSVLVGPSGGGTLVVDERGRPVEVLTETLAGDVRGGSLRLVPSSRFGVLAVLPLPAGASWRQVATPADTQVTAMGEFLRVLLGLTIAGALGALPAGYVLSGRALRPLEEAVRERTEFVALASHQLRTPLAIIRTSGELARDRRGLGVSEAFATIMTQVDRMEALAGRLTALSRLDGAGGRAAACSDLGAVVVQVADGLRPAAEFAGVTLQAEVASGCWVRGETAELGDALSAVVENAIRFSPRQGRVRLAVRREGRRIVAEVTDQGPGISPQDLPHVTRAFFQGRGPRGTHGIGLSIARAVAERSGGRLIVRSEPGRGAAVALALPAVPPPPGEGAPPSPDARRG